MTLFISALCHFILRLWHIRRLLSSLKLTPWSRVLLQKPIELYRCKKIYDLERAEVENTLRLYIGRCSCVREAEGHVQTHSDWPIVRSAGQIPRLLWNQKVHWFVHNSPSMAPVLSQINPVHILHLYFLKAHFNIILPSTPRSSEWSLPFRFSNLNVCFSHPLCALHVPPISSSSITIIIFGKEFKLCSSLCSFLQPPVTSFLLAPCILLSTLFSNTLNLCYSLNLRDQVLHPCKTTGIWLVLCAWIYTCLDSRRKDEIFLVASNPQNQSALNFLVNIILICYRRPQIFELCHICKGFISCLSCFLSFLMPELKKEPVKF
jgi:hypothetical protein